MPKKEVKVDDLDKEMQNIYFDATRELCVHCAARLKQYEDENNCIIVEEYGESDEEDGDFPEEIEG